ncbi:MAG: glycoside hydrolase family 2 protein [Spirochaetia bacterium]|nr:glycoside hydrolase family 2 protein [Spirochaetia bacterium]
MKTPVKNDPVLRKTLSENWILKGPRGESLAAVVPGTVHSDLLRHDLIPDPHFGMNEKEVLWVEDKDWVYQTQFDIPQASDAREWRLVFHGLDTISEVRLNGKVLGKTDNMFRTYVFPIPTAKERNNTLEIKFFSPSKHALALEKKIGRLKQANPGFDARQHLRKAACSYGWDWGIRLAVSGIWRDVVLEGRKKGPQIASVRLDTHSLDSKQAVLEFQGELEASKKPSSSNKKTGLRWEIRGECKGSSFKESIPVKSPLTTHRFKLPTPRTWMPRGFGEANLYNVSVSLVDEKGQALDLETFRFGVRRIEIEQKKDKAGKSFLIKVNGVPVWAKGANWIPVDSMIPRDHDHRTRRLIELAAEANMNILRVWGGGVYESDFFYDLCDEMGFLVWQDFTFACGFYPETPSYQENFIREAQDNIRRLRNHASLALWCGNNEIDWGFHEWGSFRAEKPNKPFSGGIYWHKHAPNAVKKLDPNRFYWPSSPFGSGHPNGEHDGDVHWWKIWQEQDYDSFRKCRGRFVSEFGLQAMPTVETFKEYISPEEQWIQSREVELHQKHPAKQIGQLRQVTEHFRLKEDFTAFTHTSQVFQGEGIKLAVEHWRSLRGHCSGAIYWQINDVWPVVSWASIDSELRPKALHYYASRFFAPVLVMFEVLEDRVNVIAVNDTQTAVEYEGSLSAMNFEGAKHHEESKKINIPAHGTSVLFSFKPLAHVKENAQKEFLLAELRSGGKLISRNLHFFDRFKFLKLPKPKIQITPTGKGIEVQSDVIAKSVWFHSKLKELPLLENYVDLLPGEKRFIPTREGANLSGQMIEAFPLE